MKKTIEEQYSEYIKKCDEIMLSYCEEHCDKLPKQIYTFYKINGDFKKEDIKNPNKILRGVISFDVYGEYYIEYTGYIFQKTNLLYYKNLFKNYKINNTQLNDLIEYYNNVKNNPKKYFKPDVQFTYDSNVYIISLDLLNTAYFFTEEEALKSFNKIKDVENLHTNYNMLKCDICGSIYQKDYGYDFDYKSLSNPNAKLSNRIYDDIEKHACSKSCLDKLKKSQDYEYHI